MVPFRLLAASAFGALVASAQALPDFKTITLVGDLQVAGGCPQVWDPTCVQTQLTPPTQDGVWRITVSLPAGTYNYKVAANGGWTVNYGQKGELGGANIALKLDQPKEIGFFFDQNSHYVSDTFNTAVVSVAGTFQKTLGCTTNDDVSCLAAYAVDKSGTGTYAFNSKAIPAGTYTAYAVLSAKDTVPSTKTDFTVTKTGAEVAFVYDAASSLLLVTVDGKISSKCSTIAGAHDNCVVADALLHNTRDDALRAPQGAVTVGQKVNVRLQTRAGDATGVQVQFESLDPAGKAGTVAAKVVAAGVDCFGDDNLSAFKCDVWEAQLQSRVPTVLFYHFKVTDGTASYVYGDDVAFDNGVGQWAVANPVNKFAVTFYPKSFDKEAPKWMQNAVVYEIFPDRFRNGDVKNDPVPYVKNRYTWKGGNATCTTCGELSEAETLHSFPQGWTDLPEAGCNNWLEGCTAETKGSYNRDWFGGDLNGAKEKLAYIKSLGVTVVWLNPIFDAASNHGYDTRDFTTVSEYFGGNEALQTFVDTAEKTGIRVVLDGVFNHVASDSKYFDKYGNYPDSIGACESVDSPYRDMFMWTNDPNGPCVGEDGKRKNYYSFLGYDTLATLNKSSPAVKDLTYTPAADWLKKGVAGWRLDAAWSGTYTDDYWPGFRKATYSARPDTFLVGEVMAREQCLPLLYGTKMDAGMNYRFRDAVMAYLIPEENGGNEDPEEFANGLEAIREDYADRTYLGNWNLIGSHDFPRFLWIATPGKASRAERELDAANVAVGKKLLKIATTLSFTVPGTPMIMYGDEIGQNGAQDPDTRRTFNWTDIAGTAAPINTGAIGTGVLGLPKNVLDLIRPSMERKVETADPATFGPAGDHAILHHTAAVSRIRQLFPVFRTSAAPVFLLADKKQKTLAYLLRDARAGSAAVVVVNRAADAQSITVAVPAGLLPNQTTWVDVLANRGKVVHSTSTTDNAAVTIKLDGLSATTLILSGKFDSPSKPHVAERCNRAAAGRTIAFKSDRGAKSYNVYRSVVSGGGYLRVATVVDGVYAATPPKAGTYYYIARAVSAEGVESESSREVAVKA